MVAAANVLGMSRSMVTRYLNEMEAWAEARLLHRSTRKLSLTPAGESVEQYCRQLLTIADQVPTASSDANKGPTGLLRISSPHFMALEILTPIIQNFLKRYPDVSIDQDISNQTVNLVEERIDLAIRITNDLDPNLIARPLGVCNSIICATPDYIKNNGSPKTPDELSYFNCLAYSYFGNNVWYFKKDDEFIPTRISGDFSANEPGILLQAVLAHSGISQIPRHTALPYLSNKQLIEVLPEYQVKPLGIYGVYRSREHMPIALRLMLNTLVESFEALDI